MNLYSFEDCVCRRMGNVHTMCLDDRTLEEQGKRVRLTPGNGESAKTIVIDGCALNDNFAKCDGLFLLHGHNCKWAVLVELKGASDIPHAFEQLAYVRDHRPQYRTLCDALDNAAGNQPVRKKYIIVSNGQLDRPKQERLEREHGIRVKMILDRAPNAPIPELRDKLR